jgi:hypothetical protein
VVRKDIARAIASYEAVVAKYPRSAYSDNALWQAGMLSASSYGPLPCRIRSHRRGPAAEAIGFRVPGLFADAADEACPGTADDRSDRTPCERLRAQRAFRERSERLRRS